MRPNRWSVLATLLVLGACAKEDSRAAERQYAALGEEPVASAASQAVAAHTAFRRWLDDFKQAVPNEQQRMAPTGEWLASIRRQHLPGLMLDEPELALSMALTTAERRMVPPSIAQHLEQWRDGRGMVHVIGAMDDATPLKPKAAERFVTFEGRDTVLRAGVYGRRAGLKTMDGLRLHGIELDGAFALFELPARKLRPEDVGFYEFQPGTPCPTSRKATTANEVVHDADTAVGFCQPLHAERYIGALSEEEAQAAADQIADSAWTEGPKTVLFMRVDFADRPGDPLSLASAQALINTNVNNFFVANSFNKTNLTGVFPPTLRVQRTYGEYRDAGNYLQLLSDARLAARDAGYDPANYNLDIVAHPSMFPGWAGRGYVGGRGTWLNGSFGQGVTAHELGHNYGLWHANFWSAGESIIGAGSLQEYGNVFDVMGNSGASHFNAWFKRTLDWIPAAKVQTVTTSGTYRIYPLEVAGPDAGMQGLKVTRNDRLSRDYWLEFRQALTGNVSLMNGASVNFGFPFMSSTGSHLLDLTPDGDRTNSALVIGRTYSDVPANLHFTAVGKGGTTPESLDVVVNFGPYPSNRAPTVTVTASATTVPSNTSVTFTATAADLDGDTLAYSWDFDDGTFSVNNAPTATKTLAGNRLYRVRCTVSDMKGGRAIGAVVVTVGTPANFSLQGTITLAGAPVDGVRVTDGTRSTFSTSDGTWQLNDVPAGSYTINASKFDLAFTRSFAAPLMVSANTTMLDFTAAPRPGYSISGRVTAGAGVAGVVVSDGSRTATTNSNGDFTLAAVPNGQYTLTATKAGWTFVISGRNPVEVLGGNVTGINFFAQGQSLNGQLPANLATAPVVTDGYRTATATRGNTNQPWSYYLSGVPNGTWNVTATSPGVTLEPSGFTNPVTVAGMSVNGLNFQIQGMTTTFAITGTARTGGTPLPGVTVSDGTRASTTDSLGRYVISGVPAGTFTLTPTRAGYTFAPATRMATVTTANVTGIDFDTTVVNMPPTLAMAPSATQSPTTGTTVQLSVLGADDGGEAQLSYQWTSMSGGWPLTFSVNGTNGAKTVTVTFSGAGSYTFEVVVTDAGGLSVRGTVTVMVTQVATGMEITPAAASVPINGMQFFNAQGRDQFSRFMFLGPPTWSVSGGGTVSTSGQFMAGPTPGGPFTLTAMAGGRTATASVTVVGSGAPTIVTPARASPSPVTGTTTVLTVQANDDAGEASLLYTWTATMAPGPVTFSVNANNQAKTSTATFSQAGDYEFLVTILDTAGNMVTSVVRVTVQAVPSAIELQPRVANVVAMGTQTFTAVVQDQFGDAITPQPAITFAVSGGGAVDAAGQFTAGATPGGPFTLTATSGTINVTATITVDARPDTTPPQVQLTAPVNNTQVMGSVTLVAQATDDVGVTRVQFFEGTTQLGQVTAAPWQLVVDTSSWSNGTKSLTARAFDAAGNTATSDVVTVTVGMMADVSPPTISLTAPTMNAMTGLGVTVTADAMDDVGVTRVEFELDGTPVGTVTAAPYQVTTTVSAGAHSVVAIAFDASGKFTRSMPVAFTAVGPDEDGGVPTDAGTQPVDAGQQEPDAGVVEADGGTTQPTAGGAPGREGKQELVIGGCGCNGGGAGLWSLLALVVARRFGRRARGC
jgi:hypothetical protein